MLEGLTTSVARSRAFGAFVGLLERMDREEPNLLRTLTYHRVEWDHASPAPSPGLTVSPDAFAEQMQFIQRHYHAVSAEQVIHAVQGGGRLAPRSVLITFDDGYRDFRSQAWPVLKALGLPVVLFVPTAFPGDPTAYFWWDRLRHTLMNTPRRNPLETVIGRLPLATGRQREDASVRLQAHAKRMQHAEAMSWVRATCSELDVPLPPRAILSWDELRELANDGVTVASHTRTHALLTRIAPEAVSAEVRGAANDLRRELGTTLPILAYPAGAFDDGVVRILEQEGHVLAFTTVRGVNELRRACPLKLRRTSVGRRTSAALLRAQLLGRSVRLNRICFPEP